MDTDNDVLKRFSDLYRADMVTIGGVHDARADAYGLPAEPASAPRVVVCRLGYVSPEVDGLRCAGATFASPCTGAMVKVRLPARAVCVNSVRAKRPCWYATVSPSSS